MHSTSMVMAWRLLVALASLATVSAFVPTLRPKLAPARAVAFAPLTPVVAVPRRQLASVQMGLFGLGWAEIGVIGILALFIFGPERLAPFAKEFGKPPTAQPFFTTLPALTTRAAALSCPQANPLPD